MNPVQTLVLKVCNLMLAVLAQTRVLKVSMYFCTSRDGYTNFRI